MQSLSRVTHRYRSTNTEIKMIKQQINLEAENLKNQLNSTIAELQRKIKPFILSASSANGANKMQKTE